MSDYMAYPGDIWELLSHHASIFFFGIRRSLVRIMSLPPGLQLNDRWPALPYLSLLESLVVSLLRSLLGYTLSSQEMLYIACCFVLSLGALIPLVSVVPGCSTLSHLFRQFCLLCWWLPSLPLSLPHYAFELVPPEVDRLPSSFSGSSP